MKAILREERREAVVSALRQDGPPVLVKISRGVYRVTSEGENG